MTLNLLQTALLAIIAILPPTLGLADSDAATPAAIHWQRWSDAVLDQARRQNKLIFVDLAADWCTFCNKMDQTTWTDTRVITSINQHYIPVRIQDEVDPKLAEKYRQYGRPAFFVLNANGVEIARKRGYLAPQWMYWMLKGIAENPTAEANR